MNDTKKLLEVRDLHKAYSKEGVPTKALNGITFDVLNGEYLGIMGASGSGKTTLLNCIATVIKPTSGQILLSGANISSFDGTKLAEYRGNKIGYLFQDFALLDNLTGKESYKSYNRAFSRAWYHYTPIKFFCKCRYFHIVRLLDYSVCSIVCSMRKAVP